MAPENPIFETRRIYIQDDRIVGMGEDGITFPIQAADHVLDAKNCIVLPGLINAHTHTPMTIMRSIREDLGSFLKPGSRSMLPRGQDWTMNLQPEDHYLSSLLAIAEMLRCGTTTFVDMYREMDRVAEAVVESGIRACLGWEIFSVRRDPERWLPYDEDVGRQTYEQSGRFASQWNGRGDGRIRTLIAPHETGTCHEPWLSNAGRLAGELGVELTLHLAESENEVLFCRERYNHTPAELLQEAGILEHHVLAAHCTYLSQSDIDLLGKKRFHAVICPQSYLKLANPMPPIQAMRTGDINLALGTDSAITNNNLDLWEEIRCVSLMQKYLSGDPAALPGLTALQMATAGAAAAINLKQEVGTIEVGKKADIIILSTDKPHWHPLEGVLPGNLMYASHSSDVRSVLVDGRILMEDWEIKTFDEGEVIRRIQERIGSLRREVGLPYSLAG